MYVILYRYSSTGSESSVEEGITTSLSVIHTGPHFVSGTIRNEQGMFVQCMCIHVQFCLEAFTTYSIVQQVDNITDNHPLFCSYIYITLHTRIITVYTIGSFILSYSYSQKW